jgi:hypothetical protein
MAGQVFLSEYHGSTIRGVMAPRAPALVVQAPVAASGVAASFAPFSGSTELIRSVSGSAASRSRPLPMNAGLPIRRNGARWRQVIRFR